ncbi:ABC-type glycerol-3-phosphate transport system substrate-binding protein [Paenibacillus castaneae]|uniref:ABC transporter substrate-binding protein n=2 Tax=Paenibacillus TaxID=44249 RepID=UPI000C9A7CEB|nr:extracellular solute-binding protein [Paenibacillus castaneae]NIK75001.1 ABC-type glycerol-3-phosphate transport system substrate-binding protein [Paenibacillus castaneae]
MVQNKKSFSIMLAAVVMLVSVMAGCSGSNNGDNNTTKGSTNSNGNKPAVTEEAASDAPKLEDGNITILYHTSKEQYDQNKAANPAAFDAVWETVGQFEQAYGGKVNVIAVPWGDQKPMLISMVNAGDRVDVAQANDQNFPVYPLKKIVQPLDQYMDLSDPFWNSSVSKAFTFGGKHYAAGVGAAPIVIYYNKTLFDNNGVKTPGELYSEGNWTWDTFRSTALELTQDTDGDGKSDQFGFGWWDAGYPLMVASNGVTNLSYNEDGSITTNYESDNMKEAMQFTQDALLKDKYIDKDKEGDYFNAEFKNGKLAMTAEYGFGGFTVFKSDYELDFVPVPTGPKGTKDVGPGGMSGWSIPTVSKNPQGAAIFIKMMSENELKVATDNNVKQFGQEKVDQMNDLGTKILFAPIGVEKYWDANTAALTGIKDGTPVGTFAATAKALLEEGIKITLTQ